MKRFPILFAFIALLFVNVPDSGIAQITQNGQPHSFAVKINKQAAYVEIQAAPQNWEETMFAQSPALKPYLFAWPVKVQVNVIEPDNLVYEDEQYEIYKLNIHTVDAYSLNVIFDNYLLPDGVQVYLYDPEYNTINGAYTALNNKESATLATSPIPGNHLVIEVNVDKYVATFKPKLIIGQVSIDKKNAFGLKSGFGKSGDCNVDINCPQGADWQLEKRAVCKFIRGGTWLCSGALINNTANDGRALLLTAHHCITTGLHARTSVFYFKYESSTCYGKDGSVNFSISSSDLLATTNKLDFTLVELSLPPPESYDPYYAGWDRSNASYILSATCIHHPGGDVKKISGSNRRITTGDFGGGFDENTHWHIAEWDYGTTEGGSSGSPLFNSSHKIIGDLTGGDASCSYNFNDYFEKFWVSWDRYPGHDEQLKVWLDPEGLNPTVWNGFDPYGTGHPLANFMSLPDKPVVGKYIRFTDISSGAPEEWAWSFQDGIPGTSARKNPLVYFDSPGYKQISLIVFNGLGVDSVKQTLWIDDRVSFDLSRARIVKGSVTTLSNTSTTFLPSLSWKTQKENDLLIDRGGSVKLDLSFENSGLYNVLFQHEKDGVSTFLYHQNMIRVTQEKILFAGSVMSPYNEREVIAPFSIGNSGKIPGGNTMGFEAFANAFEKDIDTTVIITGVRTYINSNAAQGSNTWLSTVIWDGEWNEIRRDSMKLYSSEEPFWVTNWLDPPIGLDTLVYVGFELPSVYPAGFASGLTITRANEDANSAWGLHNGKWKELNQYIGINTAMGIQLETANFYEDYGSQIKVLNSIAGGGTIQLDLGNLVYKSFDVSVFSIDGKKIISETNQTDNNLEVHFSVPVSGIYLLRIELDQLSFTKKIMIIRTN